MLSNNLSEYFNKFILGAKDKLILTCVDTIMTKIIQRIAQKKEEAKKVIEPLCPKIQKKLDTITELCNRNSINVLTIIDVAREARKLCGPLLPQDHIHINLLTFDQTNQRCKTMESSSKYRANTTSSA